MADAQEYRIKEGGTFEFFLQLEYDGVPLTDLTPYTASASLKRGRTTLATFSVTETTDPEVGAGWLFTIPSTTGFNPGPADFDILLTKDGDTYYSETKRLVIEPSVTRPGDV